MWSQIVVKYWSHVMHCERNTSINSHMLITKIRALSYNIAQSPNSSSMQNTDSDSHWFVHLVRCSLGTPSREDWCQLVATEKGASGALYTAEWFERVWCIQALLVSWPVWRYGLQKETIFSALCRTWILTWALTFLSRTRIERYKFNNHVNITIHAELW